MPDESGPPPGTGWDSAGRGGGEETVSGWDPSPERSDELWAADLAGVRVVVVRPTLHARKETGSWLNGQMNDGPLDHDIHRAKLKTLFFAVAGLAGGILTGGPAIVFAGLSIASWYRKQTKIDEFVRKGMVHARREDVERFRRIVTEMADAAGMSVQERPQRVVVIENELANAGSTRPSLPRLFNHGNKHKRSPVLRSKHGYMVGSSGLLRAMGDDELRAVVGHELTHWEKEDSRYIYAGQLLTHVVGALRGFIPFAAAWLAVGPFAVSPGLVVKAAAAALGAVTTWHYATWVGASIAAHTMRSTVSRAVEYRADRGGARLAGDTEIMASSLRTLDIHNRQVNTLLGVATSFARTACGLGYEKAPNPAQRVLATVFADHPSNYYRIRKLNLEKQRSAVQGSGVSGVA